MTTHNAPPVVYPLGRSRIKAWMLAVLWIAGLLSFLFWLDASRSMDWRAIFGGTAVLFAGFVAIRGWINSPIGQIAWDGQVWRWESEGYQTGVAEQSLFVIADFQSVLLLRLENQAHASLWLWAEQKSFPARWLDLRRAVYSPHRVVNSSGSHGVKRARHADAGKVQP